MIRRNNITYFDVVVLVAAAFDVSVLDVSLLFVVVVLSLPYVTTIVNSNSQYVVSTIARSTS